MKRGIEAWSEWDEHGRWTLVIEKKCGKLTLEEIMRTAREQEWDYYLLSLDCYHEDFEMQFVPGSGFEINRVVLYRTEDLMREAMME